MRPKSGESHTEVHKARPAQGRSALLGSQDVWYDTETSEMDDLASQQETKRIYLVQQIHNSLFDFEDRLNEHLNSRPHLDNSRPSNLERQLLYPRKTSANRFRNDSQSSFRPQQMILPELGKNASHRSQRSFRKEPWSPSDESYLRTFADDSKQVEYHKDQTQRINEMLSIVEGLPSDAMKEPKWLGGRNDQPVIRSYFRPRSPSPPPFNHFDTRNTEDISQARLRAVEPFPENTLQRQPLERFPPQLRPVEQRSPPPPAVQRFQSPPLRSVERQTPTEPTEHRFKSPPLRPVSRHTPTEPFNQRFVSPPLRPVERQTPTEPSEHRFQSPTLRPVERPPPKEPTPQWFESPPLRQVLRPTPKPVQQAAYSPPPPPQQMLTRIPSPPVRQGPPSPKKPEPAPVPTPAPVPAKEPPKMIIIRKNNPVPPSKSELEKVNLRRAAPKTTIEPQTNELYSHVLKKTGNRSKLGVPDDEGDGTVTRVNFNVPLQVST